MSEPSPPDPSAPRTHLFEAVAFAEDVRLLGLEAAYPEARRSPQELRWPVGDHGEAFLHPFGAMVFRDVPPPLQERELLRLREARPGLTGPVRREEIRVEEGASPTGVRGGCLHLDRLTPERAGIVALTVAQSAAMEYYEGIVEDLLERTNLLVDKLEKRGTVPLRTSPLHRFIGEAVGTRNEALSVLHLLDKPDAAWDDGGMDAIYDDLKDEFDLSDRFHALEYKLRSVQESLELLLDVARDRRLVLLEVTIVVLIVVEIVLSLVRPH
jgi:uncharacterized Rmd1/YagE family protein